MARNIIVSVYLPPTAINKGVISASGEYMVRYFNFPEGCSSVEFEVRDELGVKHELKAKRRMHGDYPIETITGLKTYMEAKGLVVGDRITIYKDGEVKVVGAVLRRPIYSIHFEKVARGGGNFASSEAGEN